MTFLYLRLRELNCGKLLIMIIDGCCLSIFSIHSLFCINSLLSYSPLAASHLSLVHSPRLSCHLLLYKYLISLSIFYILCYIKFQFQFQFQFYFQFTFQFTFIFTFIFYNLHSTLPFK